MLDRYAYVRNNPLRYTDPTGLGLEELTPEGAAALRRWADALRDLGVPENRIVPNMLRTARLRAGYLPLTSPTAYRTNLYGWFTMAPNLVAVRGPQGGPGAIGFDRPSSAVTFSSYVHVVVTSADGSNVSGTATIITYSNNPNWFYGEIEVEFDNGEEAALQVDGSKTAWREWKGEGGGYYQVIQGHWSSDQGGMPSRIELEPWHEGGGCAATFVLEFTDRGAFRQDLYPVWY